jgi:hypothetical protein
VTEQDVSTPDDCPASSPVDEAMSDDRGRRRYLRQALAALAKNLKRIG